VVDVTERAVEGSGFASLAAVALAASAAVSLAILPAAIALHSPGVPPGWAAGAVGMFAAVIAMGKLAAMAWGAGLRLWGLHGASVSAAYAD
jgi:hypothetical protein